ncbi:MAG TPA: hypothetical protein VER58_12410 [Thermoanaerobaculia bacterium]|nr:hypothetical protein [Thermoanaerobaculia bacterium]
MMRRVIAIVIAAYLVLVLFNGFVLVELFLRRVGIPILFAVAASLACIGSGFLARRLRPDIALNFIVGYPIFGAICFLAALMKISAWTMVPMVGILGGVGAAALGRSAAGEAPAATPKPATTLALALIGLSALIEAQAPPSTLDELAYHLAVPWTWVKEGRAIDLPLVSHSYFPLGIESADIPFLAILGTGGGVASHFLHLFAAIAVVVVLLRNTKDCPIMTVAIVATPALALTAGWSLVDWIVLGVSLALVNALENDDVATVSAAVAAGLLTKYTFVPIALIAILVTRRFRGVLPGVAVGSIFFIRNLILTGNPIAPFFGALAPHVAHYRAGAFFSDYVFDGRFIDESLGASLFIACTLTVGLLPWILMAAGALLFLLAPSARLLVPFFAIPAARALPPTRPIRVALAMAVVMQLFLVAFFTDRTEAFALLSGRLDEKQYLATMRPSTTTIASVDAALPPNSCTLLIGLNETYWFQHRVRGGGNFDGQRISAYLDAGNSDALYARLRRDGITHIAVFATPPPTAVETKVEERQTILSTGAGRTLAQTLDRHTLSVTQRGNATLFALKP